MYKCHWCGKTGAKLWHPEQDESMLICARCAEVRQSPIMYNEYKWSKDKLRGDLTGRKLPLPEWKVNERGEVPSYAGFNAWGKPYSYTSTLILGNSKTKFVPANEDGLWDKFPVK